MFNYKRFWQDYTVLVVNGALHFLHTLNGCLSYHIITLVIVAILLINLREFHIYLVNLTLHRSISIHIILLFCHAFVWFWRYLFIDNGGDEPTLWSTAQSFHAIPSANQWVARKDKSDAWEVSYPKIFISNTLPWTRKNQIEKNK